MEGVDNVEHNDKNEHHNRALRCEKELIPVLAGECRASPVTLTTPMGSSMIRSSSAEVL